MPRGIGTGDGTSLRVNGSLEIGSCASRIGGGGPHDRPKERLQKALLELFKGLFKGSLKALKGFERYHIRLDDGEEGDRDKLMKACNLEMLAPAAPAPAPMPVAPAAPARAKESLLS